MTKRFGLLLATIGMAALMAFLVSAVMADVQSSSDPEWDELFRDTFTTTLPIWSFSDELASGYQWGVTPYTRTVEGLATPDQGLWAAGGGALGSAQSWLTGTYTNSMLTLAVAGPFTLTEPAQTIRLTARVLNRSAAGDQLFLGLSDDGLNPIGDSTVLVDAEQWQTITVTLATSELTDDRFWIYLRFFSDGSEVDTGPLVDDLRLDTLTFNNVYIPIVRIDPTPTPTPTPIAYHDDFSDRGSGWYEGSAFRYNEWCRWGWDCHSGYEEVAKMDYVDGHYRIYVPLDWRGRGDVDTWFVWPAQMAPLTDTLIPLPETYCIEVRGVIANSWETYQPWWGHWGIVFGADETGQELFSYQINANHRVAVLHHQNYVYPGDRQEDSGDDTNEETLLYHWSSREHGNSTHEYNQLKVFVQGEHVEFYVNGLRVDGVDAPGLARAQIGVIAGSWEVTPVEVWFDYFHYEPDCVMP